MDNIVFSGRARYADNKDKSKRVCFCVPTIKRPFQVTLDSIEASLPLIEQAGWDHGIVYEVGNPYISQARSMMLRKALDWDADVIVFIDHDLSWRPEDLLLLIETEPDVVGGTYRFKRDEVEYMGRCAVNADDTPVVEQFGDNPLNRQLIRMEAMPAGFLKITKKAVNRFMAAYPELCYGDRFQLLVDLFNHGAHEWQWWGEDYAFCRRYNAKCGQVYCLPNLELDHHLASGEVFKGNFDQFLRAQPR